MNATSSVLSVETAPFRSRSDIARIAATPIEQRIRATCVHDLVADAARRWPNATAIRFLPRGLASDAPVDATFSEIARRVTQTANLFSQLGVGRGDGVAILLPTMPEAFVTIWAAETAGIACPINPLLSSEHLAEILRHGRQGGRDGGPGHRCGALDGRIEGRAGDRRQARDRRGLTKGELNSGIDAFRPLFSKANAMS